MTNKRKWKIGMIVLVFVLLLWSTLFLNYETMNANAVLSPPNASHWFGTDDFGRDIFIRVIVGARYSIGASLFIVGLSYLGGILLGGLAGIFGERIDRIITSIIDILLAIPSLLIAITVAGVLGGELRNGIIALVISYLPYYAKKLINSIEINVNLKKIALPASCHWRRVAQIHKYKYN